MKGIKGSLKKDTKAKCSTADSPLSERALTKAGIRKYLRCEDRLQVLTALMM